MLDLRLQLGLWGGLAGLVLAGPAGAVVIEDFNSDGAGTRYAVTGGGGSGDDFWGLQSIGNSFGFTGQEGLDFFGGRDLNGAFAGGANPLTVEIPLSGGIPVPPVPTPVLSILLAANDEDVWDAGQDYFRIVAIDVDGGGETVLDEFLPNAARNLESTTHAGVALDTTFAELTYVLPGGISNLAVRIEAYSTGDAEYLGFDFIQVVPEPGPAATLGLGLLLLAAARSKPRARNP